MTRRGLPVVTSQEMLDMERRAYLKGASDAQFMQNAALAIANEIGRYLGGAKHVILLVGKGNNGGDAFAAGVELLRRGFKVTAWHLFPLEECSPLCRMHGEAFRQAGGKAQKSFEGASIIIDGLLGTGFRGKVEGTVAEVIIAVNSSGVPILSIDIPSGLNGSTGEVETVAIMATKTISLGLPKLGFFIGKGWDHVGELVHAEFGLSPEDIKSAKPSAFLFDKPEAKDVLPHITRSRHKYEAGYVLGVAGSLEMPGAALLSAFAVLRSGAGIVRLFHPAGMEVELSAAAPEVIKEEISMARILEEGRRADAVFIGPGLGRNKETQTLIKDLLEHLTLPCVLDADALYALAEHPQWKLPSSSILTPHHGEMQRLLGKTFSEDTALHAACQEYAETKHITLVLKGAPTFIFHPKMLPLIIPHGDPGMATAGSGDVLTGVIAALLAQKMRTREAAALGVYLHAIAGEVAAKEKTSQSMVASDITEHLPQAFASLAQ